MVNIKQDINVARKPEDIERRYKLGEIAPTEKRVTELEENISVDKTLSSSSPRPVANSVITIALQGKINSIPGKTLTSNDFTDTYRTKLDGIEDNANNYTPPIGSVLLFASEVTDLSLQSIGTTTIGTTTVYCYKKIS